jgi:PHP family Zn ribbon phosphoesterase
MSLPGHVEFDIAAKLVTTLFPTKKEIDGDDPKMVAITESFKEAIQAEYDCSTWSQDIENYDVNPRFVGRIWARAQGECQWHGMRRSGWEPGREFAKPCPKCGGKVVSDE